MKKICYVTTVASTIKAFFVETLEALIGEGYDITVICNCDEDIYDILPENVKFISVKMNRGIEIISSFKAIKTFYKIFKREQFDLIQYSSPNASFYAAIASFFAHIKIRIYHNMGFIGLSFTGIKKRVFLDMEKIICFLSHKVQFTSRENLEFALKNKLVTKEKAYIVWNGSTGGVNLTRFNIKQRSYWSSEIRVRHKINREDFVIGFIGRINKDKGINELLNAFKNLKCRENLKLLLVGTIDDMSGIDDELWKWANCEAEIILCGERMDVEKYYAAINVLVLPSYREGFGNVIIEAAAMGTPSIASNIPGPREIIINGKTGLLIEPRNENELCDRLEFVLNNKNLLSLMGEYACEIITQKYDSRILNEKILEDKRTLLNPY